MWMEFFNKWQYLDKIKYCNHIRIQLFRYLISETIYLFNIYFIIIII